MANHKNLKIYDQVQYIYIFIYCGEFISFLAWCKGSEWYVPSGYHVCFDWEIK